MSGEICVNTRGRILQFPSRLLSNIPLIRCDFSVWRPGSYYQTVFWHFHQSGHLDSTAVAFVDKLEANAVPSCSHWTAALLYFPFVVRILHLFSKTCSSAFKNGKQVFVYSAVKQNKINILKKKIICWWLAISQTVWDTSVMITHQHISFSPTKTRWQPSGFKRTHTSLTDAMIHTADKKKEKSYGFVFFSEKCQNIAELMKVNQFWGFFSMCILKAYRGWYMGRRHCETGRCL